MKQVLFFQEGLVATHPTFAVVTLISGFPPSVTLMASPLSHSLPDTLPQANPQSISGFILNHLYQQVISQKPTVKKCILECDPPATCVGIYTFVCIRMGFPCGSAGKKSACQVRETWVRSLGWEHPLEKRKATHASILGLPLWLSW